MADPVRLAITADRAVITIDNPPLNVTSQAVRAGLRDALQSAAGLDLERIILTGAGSAFVAGADAREFDAAPLPPHLPDLIAMIENSPIPVIAAINGVALGGGLELALGCAARVAAPAARLGLPEVTLGVVPGAGGTQRLPRLIGLGAAVGMIAEGRAITAEDALSLGLIDAVADDPVAAASALTLPDRPPTGDLPAPAPDAAAAEAARQSAGKRMAGQIAPLKAIELVEAATRLPLDQGLALERQTFLDLKTSDQAAALRHVFFAERRALARGREGGDPIEAAVVVGGGTMGAGIAYALSSQDIRVTLVEADEAAADRARRALAGLHDQAVSRGKLTRAAADSALAQFRIQASYDALPPAQIAIEAVFEDLAVKQQVFAALDQALPATTILATNTSYLDPDQIAQGLSNPARFLGLHFFSPAHLMKLVEVIRASQTAPETLATVLRLTRRLGKIAIPAGICDGFIGNRILTRYRQTCDIMLIDGALPAQIDAALRGFGMAMGPYEVQDLSGLDIAHANRLRQNWAGRADIRYVPIADRIVEETGRLGRKTGAGWYDHGGGGPVPSPQIEALVAEESARAGIARRTFTDAEIVQRAVTAMMAEGLQILDEGIAERAADIDLVLIHGYGFPRWRGGPMHMAERQGLAALLHRINGYAQDDPLSWPVPPILRRAVDEGLGLSQLTGVT